MSYVEIYAFDCAGNGHLYGEIKNSWSGAPAVWAYMEEKYLPPFVPDGMTLEDIQSDSKKTSRLQSINTMNEIWELVDDPKISEADRIVLFTTLDECLVRKEDIPKVVNAFEEFCASSNNQNLAKQAEILKKAAADPEVIAVGWNQTSINASTWGNKGGYDYERDSSVPYNCLTGTEHYWLPF